MAFLSPIGNGVSFLINGAPASGAKLFVYTAGSTTKATTFSNSAGTVPNTNPIILNARGESANAIWVNAGSFKFVLSTSADTDPPASPVWTIDNVAGINENTASLSEWLSGPTPTYVSATQFTLVGNQTADYHINRRVKFAPGGVGARISASTYDAGTNRTTVTLVVDGGTAIDPGLTAVSPSILRADIPSEPYRIVTGTFFTAGVAAGATVSTDVALGLGTDDLDFGGSVRGGSSINTVGSAVKGAVVGFDERFVLIGPTGTDPTLTPPLVSGSIRIIGRNNHTAAQGVYVYWWARKRYA